MAIHYDIYKIKRGDTLSKILKDYPHITPELVKDFNPDLIKDVNKIQEGWTIKIPGYKEIKALRKLRGPSYGYGPVKPVPEPLPREIIKNPLEKAMEAGWTEKEIKTKPITLKETLPYLPKAIEETVAKIPGVKQYLEVEKKTFEWLNKEIVEPIDRAVRERIMKVGAKPIKFYKLNPLEIAMIKRAARLGLVDPATANAYFERDMRNELNLKDYIQIRILRDKVIVAKIKGLLKR